MRPVKKNKCTDAEPAKPKLYTTLEREAHVEMVERKSQFLGHAIPCKTEVEALAFIAAMKSKYSDATHNVYAYSIAENNIMRFSDDGEPQGTAGMPVLDVIRKSGFTDACIVVTRYFGGILLGAGGLVRAYSASAAQAVGEAHIVSYEGYTEFTLRCDYSDYQKVAYELPSFGAIEDGNDFGAEVMLKLAVKDTIFEDFLKRMTEITAGRARIEQTGTRFDFR
ncbi:MAG: YigZ family protein [Clostridia bacterium]|nr:YigZ family protein [Clostridia bacterium]